MKRSFLFLVFCGLVGFNRSMQLNLNAASSTVQQAKSFQRTVTRAYAGHYLLFLPNGYGEKSDQRWPLIMFLHGLGERGSNLELVKKHGPPKIVEQKPDLPFIIVSPQCPADQWWTKEPLIALLDEVVERYAVDTNRVYITGLSMGGYGTWELGLAYPERFAAIAPICGGGNAVPIVGYGAERAESLRTLPMWVFHGAKDPVVNLEESERMVKFLRSKGCQIQFTIYPEAEHDAWTQTYTNPKLYEWFLQHSRQPNSKPSSPSEADQ